MKALKIAMIFLAMTLEVRIRASSPIVESEMGTKNISSKVVHRHVGGADIALAPEAVYGVSGPRIQWVFGEGAIQSQRSVTVASIFGQAYCERNCAVAISKSSKKISFHALSGVWSVTGLRSKDEVRLDSGASIDLNSVSGEIGSQFEFPYTLSEKDFKQILGLYLGLNPFDATWKKMMDSWGVQVEKISSLYQDRAFRSVASHKDQVDRQTAAVKAERAETERIRKEFRRRNGLD